MVDPEEDLVVPEPVLLARRPQGLSTPVLSRQSDIPLLTSHF